MMSGTSLWVARVFNEYRAGNLTAKSVFALTTLRTFRGTRRLLAGPPMPL
jgi:hypothetical protein